MKLVAKFYQEYPQVGPAFTKNGKNFINVETKEGLKPVRVYTIEQYNFLAGMEARKQKIKDEQDKLARSYNQERKVNAGFENDYIVAVLGDTYNSKAELKAQGAEFSSVFKWYFKGGTEDRYEGSFQTKKITWEEVSEEGENGCIRLKPINEIRPLLEAQVDLKEGYEFQGEIGDLLSKTVLVKRNRVLDGPWGRFVVNIMEDMEGNIYTMNTSVAEMPKRRLYAMKLRVVDHTIYNGIKQTVVKEEEWFDEEDSNY